MPIGVALLLGLLVGLIIFQIDQAISAADWELAGVLRSNTTPPGLGYWSKVTIRFLIALLLAQATATGVTMKLFNDSIEAHLQDQRMTKNGLVEADYAQRKLELQTRMLKPLSEEISANQRERAALQNQMEIAFAEQDDANQRASRARVEAGREADGGLRGYIRGEGPRFREAVRQEREAAAVSQRVSSDVLARQARKSLAEEVAGQLTATLDRKQAEYHALIQDLDRQKLQDPRWTPLRDDPLMRYIALHEIQQDPKKGAAAETFRLLMTSVLLALELSFLFIKMACAPASVYIVRMIARTKREAAQVSLDFAREVGDIQRKRPSGNLRVVGGPAEEHRDGNGE